MTAERIPSSQRPEKAPHWANGTLEEAADMLAKQAAVVEVLDELDREGREKAAFSPLSAVAPMLAAKYGPQIMDAAEAGGRFVLRGMQEAQPTLAQEAGQLYEKLPAKWRYGLPAGAGVLGGAALVGGLGAGAYGLHKLLNRNKPREEEEEGMLPPGYPRFAMRKRAGLDKQAWPEWADNAWSTVKNTATKGIRDLKAYSAGGLPGVGLQHAKDWLKANPAAAQALLYGGLGMAGGGLIGGLSELSKDPEDRNYGSSMLTGALAGGLAGAGGSLFLGGGKRVADEANKANATVQTLATDARLSSANEIINKARNTAVSDNRGPGDRGTATARDWLHRHVNTFPTLLSFAGGSVPLSLATNALNSRALLSNSLTEAARDAVGGKKPFTADANKVNELNRLSGDPAAAAKAKADSYGKHLRTTPVTWNPKTWFAGADPAELSKPAAGMSALTREDVRAVTRRGRAGRMFSGGARSAVPGLLAWAVPAAIGRLMGNRYTTDAQLDEAQRYVANSQAGGP